MAARTRWVGAAVVGASLSFAVHARAEGSTAELVVARQLFSDAVVLENEGEWERAASKLRDALAIKETPGLRFHLARCEQESGKLVEALLDYDRAAELLKSGVKAHDVEVLLEPARQALVPRIPSLKVVLPDVSGLSVEVDGKPLARALVERPLPLDPTRHQLTVMAPARRTFARAFALSEGQALVLNAELPLESEPASTPVLEPPPVSPRPAHAPARAPAPLASADPGRGRTDSAGSSKPWVLAGESVVALASLGVGVGFFLSRTHAIDRLKTAQQQIDAAAAQAGTSPDQFCSTDPSFSPCSDDVDASRAANRDLIGAVAGFVGAGVATGALVITALAWPSEREARALVPALRLNAHAGFVAVSGRF